MLQTGRKKINIVTGGAGFIGSHIVDSLIQKGEKVFCLDNLSSGAKSNIEKWNNNPNFQFINHDVTKSIKLEADRIWHFASPASPFKYQMDPIETARIIFLGTYNMLEVAKENKCKILFASTSEIYGDPEKHPQEEKYSGNVSTSSTRGCYQEGKRIGENLCFEYRRMYSLETKVVRIFNTYGPRMMPEDGRVISNFIVQALKGNNLKVYGSGNQTRTFCFIDDLVDGIFRIMNCKYSGPINLGSPNEIQIKELAHLIKNRINSTLGIDFVNLPANDPKKRKPCLKIANEKIKWHAKTNIEKGLDKTIEYYKLLGF